MQGPSGAAGGAGQSGEVRQDPRQNHRQPGRGRLAVRTERVLLRRGGGTHDRRRAPAVGVPAAGNDRRQGGPAHRQRVQAGAGPAGAHAGPTPEEQLSGADGPASGYAQGPLVRRGRAQQRGSGDGVGHVHGAVPTERLSGQRAGAGALLRQRHRRGEVRLAEVRDLPDPDGGGPRQKLHGRSDDPERCT